MQETRGRVDRQRKILRQHQLSPLKRPDRFLDDLTIKGLAVENNVGATNPPQPGL